MTSHNVNSMFYWHEENVSINSSHSVSFISPSDTGFLDNDLCDSPGDCLCRVCGFEINHESGCTTLMFC